MRDECILRISRLWKTWPRPMKSLGGSQHRATWWLESVSTGRKLRCPLCPDRELHMGVRVVDHARCGCFRASGTNAGASSKSLVRRRSVAPPATSGYLARSAEIMRTSVLRSCTQREIDMVGRVQLHRARIRTRIGATGAFLCDAAGLCGLGRIWLRFFAQVQARRGRSRQRLV